MRRLLVILCVVSLLLVCVSADAVEYTIRELPTFPNVFGLSASVAAINASGQIVGASLAYPSWCHALMWKNDVLEDLGTLPGGDYSRANGINGGGTVVGDSSTADGTYHACLWHNGKIQDLGTLLGDFFSSASGINDSGQVVGTSCDFDSNNARAVLWQNGTVEDLGILPGYTYSDARGINKSGQVFGWLRDCQGNTDSYLWQNGIMQDIGCGYAMGINDSGQVVGYCGGQAFVWHSGVRQYLGTFPGDTYSFACAINNVGQVVGSCHDSVGLNERACLWQNGSVQYLGKLPGDTESTATGINDSGQIVGWSKNSSGYAHAVLWTPIIPEPSSGLTLEYTGQLFGSFGGTVLSAQAKVDGVATPGLEVNFEGNTLWNAGRTAGPATTKGAGIASRMANWPADVYEVTASEHNSTVSSSPVVLTIYNPQATGVYAGGALHLSPDGRVASFGLRHGATDAFLYLDPLNPNGSVKITCQYFRSVADVNPTTKKFTGYCQVQTNGGVATNGYFEATVTSTSGHDKLSINVVNSLLKPIYQASGDMERGGMVSIP